MRLARVYGHERLAAACARALAVKAVSYTSVNSILKQNLDRVPLPGAQLSLVPPPAHANLRGPGYYSSAEMVSVGEVLQATYDHFRSTDPQPIEKEA